MYSVTDCGWLEQCLPTGGITMEGKSPRQVAEELDAANIFVWDGTYYALEVTTRLGLEESGAWCASDRCITAR